MHQNEGRRLGVRRRKRYVTCALLTFLCKMVQKRFLSKIMQQKERMYQPLLTNGGVWEGSETFKAGAVGILENTEQMNN